jgi:phosphatidylglycerol---prolipoprotein diacylglyceryl transferase
MSARPDRVIASRWLGRHYLGTVGRVRIPSYSAMLYLGCVVGIAAGAQIAGRDGVDWTRFALAAFLLFIPAVVGARLWYVVKHLESFRVDPRRIWRRGDGGAALDGGIILMVVASVPLLALAGISFWRFWDAATFSLMIGCIITRFGCTMNGCCAGRPTNGPLGVWLPNHRGEWRRRFPTPLLEAAWCAALLVGAFSARSYLPFVGALFPAAIAIYVVGRILLEPTRESANPARTVRFNVIVAIALFALSAATLIYRSKQMS